MRTTLSLLGLLAISSSLASAGCVTCNNEAIRSVTVQVVDSMGVPIDDASVKYSVDGSAERGCDSASGGIYGCGYEEEGDFTITVTKGAATKTQSVEVSADSCHPITETVKVTLGA